MYNREATFRVAFTGINQYKLSHSSFPTLGRASKVNVTLQFEAAETGNRDTACTQSVCAAALQVPKTGFSNYSGEYIAERNASLSPSNFKGLSS